MMATRQARRRRRRGGGLALGLGLALGVVMTTMLLSPTNAFAPSSSARHVLAGSQNIGSVSSSSAFLGSGRFRVATPRSAPNRRKESGMSMFLGQDSGILGVGAPEIAVIVLVGYFILGPTELYKLTKEVGKTIQNFRSLSTEASKSFESTMENQLELDELRKAQRELNEAFSFRRSINTDEVSDFNEVVQPSEAEVAETAAAAAGATGAAAGAGAGAGTTATPKKRKVKRRRVRKQPEEAAPPVATAAAAATPSDEGATLAAAGYDTSTSAMQSNVPDLDMSDAFETEEEKLREERMARLAASGSSSQPSEEDTTDMSKPDWFDDRGLDELLTTPQAGSMDEESSGSSANVGANNANNPFDANASDLWSADQESKAEEQDRFAAQLSGQWNDSILENEDKLGPLAKIMDRLAILEEEKRAAALRLEEEFRMRNELEEKFYQAKRDALEEAAAEVQAEAYAGMTADTAAGGGTGGGDEATSGQQMS